MNDKATRSNNRACDKKVSKPVFRHFSGVQFFTCPANYYQESYAHWFDISRNVENGMFSFDLDDPNKNIEALQLAQSLRNYFHSEKLKEAYE